MQLNNIMVDLETLDTRNSAVVVSIGAVAFDPNSNFIGPTFYAELTHDLQNQQNRGRTISASTVIWWMKQSHAAQRLFHSPAPSTTDTRGSLIAFTQFLADHGGREALLWGNGSDFDNAILGSLYETYGLYRPWSYSNNRCFRTMRNMPGAPAKDARIGVHHNALDDAMTQTQHLQKIFAAMRGES